MKNEKLCENILAELLKDNEKLSEESLSHIKDCANCRAEFEKIQKMDSLIKACAPAAPSIKDSVLSKIRNKKLAPAPISSAPRKHIPIGTISAAAAVLAIGILVYKGDILNKIDNANSENEIIVCDEEADFSPETLVAEWTDKNGGDSGYQIVADSKNSNILYSEDCVEDAEAEEAPALESYDKKELSKTDTDSSAPIEENRDISETGHLLSLLPPKTDSVDDSSKPAGTQNAVSKEMTKDSVMSDDTALNSPQGDATAEKSPEDVVMMNPHPGSGMTGASGGAATSVYPNNQRTEGILDINDIIKSSLGNISENSDAAEIYKVLSQYFPDRISYDVFANADPAEYLAFVMSIDDFETEYTENAFLGFCGKMFCESFSMTEML